MKITCFCERWSDGGIEHHLMNVFQNIVDEDIEFSLLVIQNETSKFDEMFKKLEIAKHITLSKQIRFPALRTFFGLCCFGRMLCDLKSDILYLNISNGVALCYAWIAKRHGIPVCIVHSHNSSLNGGFTAPIKKFFHLVCKNIFARQSDIMLACSDLAAKWLFPKRFLNDAMIIPNGIDAERFRFDSAIRHNIRKELGLQDKRVMGTVGRIEAQKNHAFLLRMFAALHSIDSSTFLLVVGSGSLEKKMIKLSERFKIKDSVLFYGQTDKTPQLLWAMDCFILPSLFEGNPIAGIEAQAAGLPCVFSDSITTQVAITPYVEFLPLSLGETKWAEYLSVKKPLENHLRGLPCDYVKNGKFNVKNSIKKLKEIFENAVLSKKK